MAESNEAPKSVEPNPRVEELETEFYGRLIEALPHLSNDKVTAANLLPLAHQFAEEQAKLEKKAVLDSLLPDFFKHQYFLHLLDLEATAAERKTAPDSALVVLDFDKFGDFNTKFGHPTGDKLLISASQAMLKSLRRGDTAGRVGGDELAVIVHRVTQEGAVAAARRLQAAVIQTSQEEFGAQGWSQTISVGICLIQPRCSGELVRGIADKALYASKHAEKDKNRISIAMIDTETKAVRIVPVAPKAEPTSKHK
ncbi:GGDEF domain-containing protein [Patescibacteria group bacterium]|nr:GGDEF domain-containing protein [Patescibacteria group bacterium]